mgnify:CR=1 FL=1
MQPSAFYLPIQNLEKMSSETIAKILEAMSESNIDKAKEIVEIMTKMKE